MELSSPRSYIGQEHRHIKKGCRVTLTSQAQCKELCILIACTHRIDDNVCMSFSNHIYYFTKLRDPKTEGWVTKWDPWAQSNLLGFGIVVDIYKNNCAQHNKIVIAERAKKRLHKNLINGWNARQFPNINLEHKR